MRDPTSTTGLRTPRPRLIRLNGYDRQEVDALLAGVQGRLDSLQADLERMARVELRVQELEDELREARTREDELARKAAELEQNALAAAHQAETEAAEIRAEARLEVEAAARQLDEVLQLKQRAVESLRTVAAAMTEALTRVNGGAAAPAAWADEGETVAHAQPAASPPPGSAEPVFARRVQVEAGPFADFAALSGFERALAQLPLVHDVYVRRFFDAEATIELTLDEETPLLANMRATIPFPFDVVDADEQLVRVRMRNGAMGGA